MNTEKVSLITLYLAFVGPVEAHRLRVIYKLELSSIYGKFGMQKD